MEKQLRDSRTSNKNEDRDSLCESEWMNNSLEG
jgi:hypothetical protein